MKILLIDSLRSTPDRENPFFIPFYRLFTAPALTLKNLSAVTPKEHEIETVDEDFKNVNLDGDYDVIGMSCLTASASDVYNLADEFRKRRKTVILGGCHPSALPQEAIQHADSVVVGEAEYIWPQVLKDIEQGKLKDFYYQDKPVDLKNIPRIDHSHRNDISFLTAVQASRGCPMKCEFCSISSQKYGKIYRTRSIEEIIEEIKTVPHKFICFYDPSFTINFDYTKTLFKEMRPLNKKFRCWMNANVPIHDDEFFKLASEAGCIAVDIGFETFSQETIDILGKKLNKVDLYKKIITMFHDYGITVGGSFVFGFDNDTYSVFDETLCYLSSLDLDFPRWGILTPFPGTPLFDKLEKQGRILSKNWSQYDMMHVVFQPKNMTPEELQSGLQKVNDEIYSPINILKRVFSKNNLSFNSWLWTFISNFIEWSR